eukprot:TRINITY_DN9966_c0_g4_i2.p1 TRINITY_DN9966_c0_g4~~TRINITY_DN9966_c0_g4_i2.p1  ORF type:complete len:204 (+),score=49.27 TRINITY_DN9966_c0_g4_i2:3-614(+)
MIDKQNLMSAPAKEAVDNAGVWWRGSSEGTAGAKDGKKYTVDAWRRRRGRSERGCCEWYRWSLSAVPLSLRASIASEGLPHATSSPAFACWWCGGSPLAHEDLGPADQKEEIGFYPGLGPGEMPWRQSRLEPLIKALPKDAVSMADERYNFSCVKHLDPDWNEEPLPIADEQLPASGERLPECQEQLPVSEGPLLVSEGSEAQ